MSTTGVLPLPTMENKSNDSHTLVVGNGGLYTTIASATTAAAALAPTSTTPVTIEVRPGTYAENVTLPVYTNLIGSGAGVPVIISGNGVGTILTLPTGVTSNTISNIHFSMTANIVDAIMIDAPASANAGSFTFDKCVILFAQNAAAVTGSDHVCVRGTANKTVVMNDCTVQALLADLTIDTNMTAIQATGGVMVVNDSTILITYAANFNIPTGDLRGIHAHTTATNLSVTSSKITITAVPSNELAVAIDQHTAGTVRTDVMACVINVSYSDLASYGVWFVPGGAAAGLNVVGCTINVISNGGGTATANGVISDAAGTGPDLVVGSHISVTAAGGTAVHTDNVWTFGTGLPNALLMTNPATMDEDLGIDLANFLISNITTVSGVVLVAT